MIGYLFSMCFFKFIDYIVVLPIIVQLLLEFFNALFKTLLCVHHLKSHLCDLGLIVFFYLGLSVLNLLFILFELLLGFFFLKTVPIFDLFQHGFEIGRFLGFFKGIFLPRDNRVGFSKNDFYFFFVGAHEGRLVLRVFFVFRVKMKNDLR